MNFFTRYPKQFFLARRLPEAFAESRQFAFEDWRLAIADSVPVLRLKNAAGDEIGLLFGWVVHDGRLLLNDGDLVIDVAQGIDHALRDVIGRYACLVRGPQGLSFSIDPGGLLPAVFDPEAGVVASTPTMLFADGAPTPDAEIEEIFAFPKRFGFFPFGLTPYVGVTRLLPNHALLLPEFSVSRIWPLSAAKKLSDDESRTAMRRLTRRVTETVAAVTGASDDAQLFLSGGRDSRMVLAAAMAAGHPITCVTFGAEDSRDVYLAKKVAAAVGAPHHAIPVGASSPADLEGWLDRTGRCHFDPVAYLVTTMVACDPGPFALTGTCAEILRASNWQPADVGGDGLSVDALLDRLRIPPTPKVVQAAEQWLAGQPLTATTDILDLAKIEQIHACWAGSAAYGHLIEHPTHHPFCDREVYDLAMALPETYKLTQQAFQDFVAALCPPLLEPPINRVRGLDRLKFWKSELKDALPTRAKRILKPFR